jgi:hypothetical protein
MHGPTGEVWSPAENNQSFFSVLGQFLLIPFETLAYAMGLMAENAREMQRTTSRGMEVIVGGRRPSGSAGRAPAATSVLSRTGYEAENKPTSKERTTTMSTYEAETRTNRDLHDDMLKLVRSKILFVKREYEVAFREQEDLVFDNMDQTAFTAWKAAEFIQALERGDIEVPHRWREKNFPKNQPDERPYTENGKLKRLPEEDKKYLRVYYEVLERYPREKFRYEENQIRVLEQIRDRIKMD